MEGLRNRNGMKKIRNRYIYIYIYSMRNNYKNIKNIMMEWRDENDGMEDDGRMVKNEEIR